MIALLILFGGAFTISVSGQHIKLTVSDGVASENFGSSVAISGNTAIVGASGDTIAGRATQGSAYIFIKSGNTWTRQAKLTASDGFANDRFGNSVAISNSGDTVIVGASFADVNGAVDRGATYVFIKSGTTWTQQVKLAASDGLANDNFGSSVAINGTTAIVGAAGADINGKDSQGAAYVFVKNGTTWTQQFKLTASDGAKLDNFGNSVAINGNIGIVGAHRADINGAVDRGAAYVFARNVNNTWTQQAKLLASGGLANDNFGSSVASNSGDTVIIGAAFADIDGVLNRGAAYVFVANGTTWTQQTRLLASEGKENNKFGNSVSVSGNTAIVGDEGANIDGKSAQGAAYVFIKSGTTWTQQVKLLASDGAKLDNFGSGVAISGNTAIVGSLNADIGSGINGINQGAAYVFTL